VARGGAAAPRGWHATNLAIHAAAAAVLFLLLRRVLAGWLPGGPARAELTAVLGALWFGLQPVNSEVVNYVSARSESLAALFFLLALLAHHAAWGEGLRPLRRGLLLLAAAAAAVLSHGAKETGILLFLVAGALEFWGRPGAPPVLRRLGEAALRAVPLLVVFASYLALRGAVLPHATVDLASRPHMEGVGPDPFMGGGRSMAAHLLTQSRVLADYVLLLLFPVDLSPDHGVRIAASLSDPDTLLALGLLAATAGLVVRAALRGCRAVPLSAAWAAAALAPSVAFPLNVVMNEHRLYLPTTGLALGAGLALLAALEAGRRAGRGTLAAGLVVGCLLSFGLVDVARAQDWGDSTRLWRKAVATSPGSWRAHLHMGVEIYLEAGRLQDTMPPAALLRADAAVEEFHRAPAISPRAFETRLDLGLAYLLRGQLRNRNADPDAPPPAPGDFEEAARWFTLAEESSPRSFRARYQRGNALALLGRTEDATREFEAMARQDTLRTTIYDYPLAELYRRAGRTEDALARLDHVLSLKKEEAAIVLPKKAEVLGGARRFVEADACLQRALPFFGKADPAGKRDPRPLVFKVRLLVLEGGARNLEFARAFWRTAVTEFGYRPGPKDRMVVEALGVPMSATGTGGR